LHGGESHSSLLEPTRGRSFVWQPRDILADGINAL